MMKKQITIDQVKRQKSILNSANYVCYPHEDDTMTVFFTSIIRQNNYPLSIVNMTFMSSHHHTLEGLLIHARPKNLERMISKVNMVAYIKFLYKLNEQ